MNRTCRRALLAGALLAAFVDGPRAQTQSIDDFFVRFTDEWIRSNPDQAIQARYFTGPEQDALETQITPLTREWRRRRVENARRGLAELARFDRDALTTVQRQSADLMKWQLEVVVEGEKYQDLVFPLEQFAGANINLVNSLTVVHPLNTEKDAASYVARLGQVATRMQEAVTEARELAAKGLTPPRFIVRATIAQMQQFISTPPAQNPFVTAFSDRLATSGIVPPARLAELRGAAERVTATQIYPAWKGAIAILEPLVATTTDDAGLWRFDGGAAAYAYHLRRFTTTDLTADEIHEIGLREVARIEKEMDTLLRRLGRTEGPVSGRIAQLEKDLAYPMTEEGRVRIMSDVNGFISDAQTRSAMLFARVPRAPVVARPFPAFRENTAAANYTAPARDGSRPGTFQIPLRPSYMTGFGLRTLVYHETVPGHHFQIALELENDRTPRFRQIRALGGISALTEGWASGRGAAGSRIGMVRKRSGRPAGTAGRGALPRAPARCRYRHSCQTLDAPAGDRLRHRGQRDRSVRREPGSGLRVHARAAQDCRAERQGAEGAWNPFLAKGVPRRRAVRRHRPVDHARTRGGCLHPRDHALGVRTGSERGLTPVMIRLKVLT